MLVATVRLVVEVEWAVAKGKVEEVVVAARSLLGMEVEGRGFADFAGEVGNFDYR